MSRGLEDPIVAILIFVGVIIVAVFVTPFALLGLALYIGYRLYRDSPKRAERLAHEETMILYQAACAGQVLLSADEIEQELARELPSNTPTTVREQLLDIGRAIFEAEGLVRDVPPPPVLSNTVEGARYRDMLARAEQAGHDRSMSITALQMISQSLAVMAVFGPKIEGDVLVPIVQFIDKPGHAVADVMAPFFTKNDYNHFKALRDRLNANWSGTHRTAPIAPADYKGDDVIDVYLGGTLLTELFNIKVPFAIPEAIRFEHTHMIGGSGHGKTQTLQFQIARDLDDVAKGNKTVIVIDSQGDLIRNILDAKTVDPDRIVLIDPEDIQYPVSLNLFSVGQERLETYDELERERLTNSIIELYDFVLGSLLSAGMTQKQGVVFRYLTRLLFVIPDATIHTFRELLEPNGADKYRVHIDKLEGTAKRFFETEFDGKEFTQTKQQVLRRLYGILENQAFERMFTHPKSKLDLFSEMNAGKLILINTAKSLLKEQGTEVFGRFFIALITQAAQERATIPDRERLPTLVYIDEAQDYFDRNIGLILAQARKYRVGLVMAHQFLGQLEPKLQEAFEANTSIKLAGGISPRDARALAHQFNCDPEMIQRQPKGTFATYVRGVTDKAVPIAFPFFVLENLPRASEEEKAAVIAASRAKYAEPRSKSKTDNKDQETDAKSDESPSETKADEETSSDLDQDKTPLDDDGTGPSTDW